MTPNIYDILYATGATLSAPAWLLHPKARRKVFSALQHRMGRVDPRVGAEPLVLIHAVSLGEINATRKLVEQLAAQRPDLHFVVTSTTDTGFNRGVELYRKSPRVRVVRFPLDFSSAVRRLLNALRPTLAVLMELEVWPNFTAQCQQRHIPVLLVNGRLTEGSYRNYLRAGPLTRPMFARLSAVCAQEKTYADRFIRLGAPPDRVSITGTMKFDTAQIADRIDGQDELAESLGLYPAAPLWVAGSTGPGEEAIALDVYRRLLTGHPTLRLAIIPRKPERFNEVAQLIRTAGFELVRRSDVLAGKASAVSHHSVILGDTMGELRKFYSLATTVFVGRTLVDLGPKQHGSDMIEPAGLGKPVVIGQYTTNFTEVMNAFRQANAISEVATADALYQCTQDLLADPAAAHAMGARAQAVVREQQGATTRHVQAILTFLPPCDGSEHTPAATPQSHATFGQ